MNKVGVGTFVVVCAALAGWLALHERDTPSSPRPGADAGSDAATTEPGGGGVGGDDTFALDAGLGDLELDSDVDAGDPGDGGSVDLEDAPKSVRFGVVLVQYDGAEGAKRGVRSRADAQALADEIATLARTDFAAAVKRGDPGSVDDAGKMFRGILEPRPEGVLFSLGEGEVSAPVDTPRGYWIVKRLD